MLDANFLSSQVNQCQIDICHFAADIQDWRYGSETVNSRRNYPENSFEPLAITWCCGRRFPIQIVTHVAYARGRFSRFIGWQRRRSTPGARRSADAVTGVARDRRDRGSGLSRRCHALDQPALATIQPRSFRRGDGQCGDSRRLVGRLDRVTGANCSQLEDAKRAAAVLLRSADVCTIQRNAPARCRPSDKQVTTAARAAINRRRLFISAQHTSQGFSCEYFYRNKLATAVSLFRQKRKRRDHTHWSWLHFWVVALHHCVTGEQRSRGATAKQIIWCMSRTNFFTASLQ